MSALDAHRSVALRPGEASRLLEERLAATTAVVTVMGVGYVGLPLALAVAAHGFRVHAFDVDEEKVRALAGGRSYIRDIPDSALAEALASRRFHATADPAVIADSDVIFVCVPTPFTPQKEPDTSFIAAAARQIADGVRPGQLTILRSTSYPGTTEEIVRPVLESRGLRVGEDIFLAFVPERIDPGNTRGTVDQVPVIAGGCDPQSTRLAAMLLEQISPRVIRVSSPAVGEMAKLLENVFRNVNIALVNQVAQLCDRMGLDIWEVVEAAATKPYGFMPFTPGLVGGHCIPVDPYYLAWKAREYDFHMDFIELAARVNEEMPFYVFNRLIAALHDNGTSGHRVLVLGVAFKRDVDDARYSPALRIIELLRRHKIEVAYHDPYVPAIRVHNDVLRSVPLTPETVRDTDLVLILTDHSSVDYSAVVQDARLVFDVRNATRGLGAAREKIIRL
jgi:UDP-N-acetyl-D-glucosamine dehydrogenase